VSNNNTPLENRENTEGFFCTLPAGSVLNNRFVITEIIKTGGMGAVYKGKDKSSNTLCTIKEFRPFWIKSQEEKKSLAERFKKEGKILSNLNFHRLPKLIDYFIDNDGYYLVKEFVEGKDLAYVMEVSGNPGLPYKKVLEWGVHICEILEYLHGQHPPLIYRDLKPSNIMIRASDNNAVLIDFGIASLFQENMPVDLITTMTTMDYMSPEQLLGKSGITGDIFSLGATLYYLLTGTLQTLFDYKPLSTIVPEISDRVDRLISHSLEFRPEDRFQSVTEMKKALEKILKPTYRTTMKLAEIDLWIAYLHSVQNDATKFEAISNLEEFSDPKVTRAFMKTLKKDPNYTIRKAAAIALGKQKDPVCIQTLVDMTEDIIPDVSIACIESLGEFKDVRAFSCLINCLKDRREEVKKAAVTALEKMGDTRALKKLIKFKNNEKDITADLKKALKKAIKTLKALKVTKAVKDEDEVYPEKIPDKKPSGDITPAVGEVVKVKYTPKDKIYLKFLNEMLSRDSNLLVSIILLNKAKLDERFFELMDLQYEEAVEKDKKRADDISYLMRVMDNLKVRQMKVPPYEPKAGELEEFEVDEEKPEPEVIKEEIGFDDIDMEDEDIYDEEELEEPFIDYGGEEYPSGKETVELSVTFDEEEPEEIEEKVRFYKDLLINDLKNVDKVINNYKKLRISFPENYILSEALVWALMKKGLVEEAVKEMAFIMEPGLGDRTFHRIFLDNKYIKTVSEDMSEEAEDTAVIAFEAPEEAEGMAVIAFEAPEEAEGMAVIAFEAPEKAEDVAVIAFEPPKEAEDVAVIAFEGPEISLDPVSVAFEESEEDEESSDGKRPLLFQKTYKEEKTLPGGRLFMFGDTEEPEESLTDGKLLVFEEPEEEAEYEPEDTPPVYSAPADEPVLPKKMETERRKFVIDETTIEVLKEEIPLKKVQSIEPLVNIEFSKTDLREILTKLNFNNAEIELTLSHTASKKKEFATKRFASGVSLVATSENGTTKKRFVIQKKKTSSRESSSGKKMPKRKFKRSL